EPVVDRARGVTRSQLRDPEVAELAERVHADFPLNRVAIVVPAAVERQLGDGVQEHLARPSPAPASRDFRGDPVDPLLEPEIVHFEPGRDELAGDTPGPWAADLVEKDVAGGPDQRGAGWVVVEALGVRSLIVAAGGSLRLKERGGVAPDVGAAEARGQCIGVVAPAVEEVHTARVGGAAERVDPWGVEIPIHRGGDEADGGIAVTQVAL